MGPWRAAQDLIARLEARPIKEIETHLFGSLSKTGIGHGTDIAIILGLSGFDPVTIETENISFYISQVESKNEIITATGRNIFFERQKHILFKKKFLKQHPNALRFVVTFTDGSKEVSTYYSIGGGFIKKDGETKVSEKHRNFPHPISTEKELLNWLSDQNCSIAQLVWKNEKSINTEAAIKKQLSSIWQAMEQSIFRGCHREGILPGGLSIKRRAPAINKQLLGSANYEVIEEWKKLIAQSDHTFNNITRWISCFALAVNEENASFARVVTAPTNGAAGVIPAVLMYFLSFCENNGEESIFEFLLTASEIGSLFKKGSTISAAMGGCQAEIGVSSAMAAAGLTAVRGGDPGQVLMAAEIAMEHHLGLTCDPVNGLVQIPCIERNSMGAMKAITASQLALSGNYSESKVRLDQIIQTMWETAKDMHRKYKETSEGGLAKQINEMLPEC